MPQTDREVFEYFTADASSSKEIDYLAYAIFAHEKNEWLKHFAKKNAAEAKPADIDRWISNLTDSQLNGMINAAVEFFDQAARANLAEDIDWAAADALKSAILTEVKAASAFWKQLAMALVTALLAPIILGGVIFLLLFFSDRMPTASTVFQGLQPGQAQPQTP